MKILQLEADSKFLAGSSFSKNNLTNLTNFLESTFLIELLGVYHYAKVQIL